MNEFLALLHVIEAKGQSVEMLVAGVPVRGKLKIDGEAVLVEIEDGIEGATTVTVHYTAVAILA